MHERADSIEEFVVTTIAELTHCRQDDVLLDTPLIDLGVDSLAITTLATFVEAEYGCTLTREQLTALYVAARIDEVLLAVRHAVDSPADSDPNHACEQEAPCTSG